jgi:flagellar assembly protein FliH
MSSRARRLSAASEVRPFEWTTPDATRLSPVADREPVEPDLRQQQAHLATLERDAFAKGYVQGERAGLEAGAARAEAMLGRLAQTIEELAEVRREMIRQTERQMVQLALAIAKRVVRREIALDRDLTQTMARLALERLGDSTTVTLRLHPDDFAAIGHKCDEWQRSHVSVVADRDVSRGGCLVESDFGFIDGSIEAQFHEVARALLAEEGQPADVEAPHAR